MDGFDDLLAPSRDALERNPFADPFARPGSPDPWSSYKPTPSSEELTEDTSATEFGTELRSTTPRLDDSAFTGPSASASEPGFASYDAPEDPLESAKTLQEEEVHEEHAAEPEPTTPTEHAPTASPRSPGFKESVSAIVEDVPAPENPLLFQQHHTPPRTSSPPLTVNVNPPLTPASPPPTSPTASASASIIGHAPSSSAASIVSPTSMPLTAPSARPFYNPLDQPQSLDRSFSGLALGGESVNGWQSMGQGSQSMFLHGTQTQSAAADDEDDDDDKPILQARMDALGRTQQTGSASVPVSQVVAVIPMLCAHIAM